MKWTQREKVQLEAAVAQLGAANWEAIAELVAKYDANQQFGR